jgi:hypothetical protein
MERFDVIILGAGAAGMFCAAEAGRRGRRVLVIDHAKAPGEKIRISGGGRCNFTNLSTARECFLSRNPRFAISALSRFTPADFIQRVDAAHIAWHEKTLGQLFCDGSAKQIIQMLTDAMRAAGVTLWLGVAPSEVIRTASGFLVTTDRGPVQGASLVVATGGKSIPKMGASGFGYRLAEQFGLGLVETRPALVPLTFGEADLGFLGPLSGVAVGGRAMLGKTAFDEALLFTHRGLSGPAILQISSYWSEGQSITIDLLRGGDMASSLRAQREKAGRIAVRTALAQHLPERLARVIEDLSGLQGTLADQSNAAIDNLASLVHGWTLRPIGTEGYRTAEVTLGGVNTDDLDARTMQARHVPGLYFIGEVVDVTGWLGGYNFQWAWSSGWVAGQVV